MKRYLLTLVCAIVCTFATRAAVFSPIQQCAGWFESGYVTWSAVTGATDYKVYVSPAGEESWTQLDKELVRQYPTYYRADAVGLKAGSYKFKIVAEGLENAYFYSDAFTAAAHDRSGFAHVGMDEGIGAYKNDGTLKEGAKVLYVYADNAMTVSCEMQTSNTKTETRTGLQSILFALEKSVDNRTPLAIRIIGTLKYDDLKDAEGKTVFTSNEGLTVKGPGSNKKANVTIEGIGDDAAIHGFGILSRAISSVEYRNFAIMLCLDDCLSLDTDNKHIWIHNMDFFYGNTGGDSDQAKGDGTVDIKGKSTHCTVSYNHFYDSGKCSLAGMKSETTDCWMTYHHNWFDHSDSRHPRIRTCFYHIYNNYYDGNSKYGVGMTMGGSAFVEANYFRNCKYPMLISKQGTDAEGDGTFSGENGGVIKAFNNTIVNPKKIQYYDGSQTDGAWDAVLVEQRDAEVTATALTGGTGYNNTADAAAIAAVPAAKIDNPDDVPTIVRGNLGAGRMNHGDFTWTFKNSEQDENYGVIADLKSTLGSYQSTLVGFSDGTTIKNGSATETVNGGDGKGMDQATNDASIPSWGSGSSSGSGSGSGTSTTTEMTAVLGSDADYYWTIASNATAVNAAIAAGIITLNDGSKFQTSTNVSKDTTVYSDKVGSLQLAKGTGAATFYSELGISKICFYLVRTGSLTGAVEGSNDGTSFTKIKDYSGKTGVNELSVTLTDNYKYIRITNTANGSLHIQGLKVYAPIPETGNESDLTKIKEGDIALNLKGTYTLQAGTDFTTSSTGTIGFVSNKTSVATVNAITGVITAVAAGTATITVGQAPDETYKTGRIQFTVTVTDNRAASQLALTSNTTVALKMGDTETSHITLSGNAGTVTYKSSKTSVATVDATGKITAVAAGSATITISDPGNDEFKPGTATVTVTVEAAASTEPSEEPGEETPSTEGDVICSFSASAKAPSSSMVTVSGNYSDSKGSVSYGGTTYSDCVKIETATEIKITPDKDCIVTLIFGGSSSASGKKILLDGTEITLDANGMHRFLGTKNTTYTLKKKDGPNLFLILFSTPKSHTATISPVGYATLYLAYNAVIPTGVEVYGAQLSADQTEVTLTEPLVAGQVLKANTGVIIKGEAGDYLFGESIAAAATLESDLQGTAVEKTTVAGAYTFASEGGVLGFYRYTGEKLAANKAYLLPTGSSAAAIRVNLGEAQSIAEIEANESANATIFDLNGRRVQHLSRPGIYVVNGKKVVINQ